MIILIYLIYEKFEFERREVAPIGRKHMMRYVRKRINHKGEYNLKDSCARLWIFMKYFRPVKLSDLRAYREEM